MVKQNKTKKCTHKHTEKNINEKDTTYQLLHKSNENQAD